jgi:membrane-associated HD superfamily phosphohydrolase
MEDKFRKLITVQAIMYLIYIVMLITFRTEFNTDEQKILDIITYFVTGFIIGIDVMGLILYNEFTTNKGE